MTGGPGIANAPFISPDATPVPSDVAPEAGLSLGAKRDSTMEAKTTSII